MAANEPYKWASNNVGTKTFLIAAHDGALSLEHADSNGAATFMRNLIGIKWWAVKTGPPMKAPPPKKKQDIEEISDDEELDFSEWEIFVLFPGDGM